MTPNESIYHWSKRDKFLHLLPAIPLAIAFIGVAYWLATDSLYLAIVFLLLWAASNVPIAGICVECPYRGQYCPGLCQLYFAPLLSTLIYKKRTLSSRFLKINLALLGGFGLGGYIFAFYWLFSLHWRDQPLIVLALLALYIMHMPLSFFLLCPKCSYNDTCPMANVHKLFKKANNEP